MRRNIIYVSGNAVEHCVRRSDDEHSQVYCIFSATVGRLMRSGKGQTNLRVISRCNQIAAASRAMATFRSAAAVALCHLTSLCSPRTNKNSHFNSRTFSVHSFVCRRRRLSCVACRLVLFIFRKISRQFFETCVRNGNCPMKGQVGLFINLREPPFPMDGERGRTHFFGRDLPTTAVRIGHITTANSASRAQQLSCAVGEEAIESAVGRVVALTLAL